MKLEPLISNYDISLFLNKKKKKKYVLNTNKISD